ncbi:hypothetical protein ACPEIC_44090 [Stenotrophomonas sp. NPDC087984]
MHCATTSPAALDAFEDLDAADTLELLGKAPPPPQAARLTVAQISAALKRARRKKVALARYVHNDRLIHALLTQAFSTLCVSPNAHAYYQRQRARGVGHNAALRQLANRLVGILHGCLKTGTRYDEATAWSHHAELATG